MTKVKRPPQLDELLKKIGEHIEQGRYRQSIHAFERCEQRNIDILDALYVLRHGYHEKQKTSFDELHQTWKYSIRKKTLDGEDVRVIVAFDSHDMMIITVMRVGKESS